MATDNLGELAERIRQLARVPNLMVACDYDGTVAPLVDDPSQAAPVRDAVAAMRSLAEQANTHVTVVSGRSLRDLALLSRLPEEIRLVGSHGSEFDLGFASQLEAHLVERRGLITDEVRKLGERYSALIEEKPTGVTFHLRGMAEEIKEEARRDLIMGPASHEWIFTRNGHDIIEFSVIDTNKGTALEAIRHQVGASAVIFFGDDVTDEDGFRTLTGPDVGVKVGEGPTQAEFRVPDTETVARLLALLAEIRAKWLRGDGLVPIQNYSVLSDLRTAAIVSPQASISWLCVPRVDSAAVFASLLGGPTAGHFSIWEGQQRSTPLSQQYLADTMVLETRFRSFTVTDFLDSSSGRTRRLAGRSDLLRILEGTGEVIIEFAPRLDFGRAPTRLEDKGDGIAVLGTADLMVLRSPGVTWEIVDIGRHQTAVGRVVLDPDVPVSLELRSGTGTVRPDARTEQERLADTAHFWSNWVGKLDLPVTERDLVARSALILKSLCHGPTGAIISAATTSLPTHLGGVRNWDYRYCWLRDAAMVGKALVRLGSRAEAMAFLDWVLQLLETRAEPERLAPLYNVTGRHLPPEAEIADLPGYGGSRPVRVGNSADGQVQLDLFGSVVDLVHTLLQSGEALSAEHWRLVEAMVLAVSHRWAEPDHGIWGLRKPPRHHVYSKVMCWVTVDRAISIADQFLDREPGAWIDLRERIAADVLEHGWDDELQSFTAAYGSKDLDASVLAIGLTGLLAPNDKRFGRTVEAVERALRTGSTLRRYETDDGLPGREGGYNLATSWLVDALCLIGQRDRAAGLFTDVSELAGDTGIMTEQHDPEHDRALGNIPHAHAHIGLINNVLSLDEIP
ncbi:MAG: trehalose-phosphatase [Acidimicrobiia bacterium]|nr:trehalose-phosphatase [Acidimicrobiia bacterium]